MPWPLSSRAASPAQELDGKTLARAQRGDARACHALVECYQRRVFALLSRILGPRGRAAQVEDLAQETFLRVFRNLPGFVPAGPAKLSTWILTIATRLALDLLRRRHAEGLELDHAVDVAAPEQEGQGVEQRLLRQAVARAVEALGPEQRAVVVLRAYHDLSYEEIAVALDVEVGTVKSRMARAKTALQQALGGEP